MHYSINRLGKKLANRRRLAPVGAVLALLLVIVQSGDLIHTHDSEFQQFDCEICLKLGSSDEVIPSALSSFSSHNDLQFFFESEVFSPFLAVIAANPRAPPLATLS